MSENSKGSPLPSSPKSNSFKSSFNKKASSVFSSLSFKSSSSSSSNATNTNATNIETSDKSSKGQMAVALYHSQSSSAKGDGSGGGEHAYKSWSLDSSSQSSSTHLMQNAYTSVAAAASTSAAAGAAAAATGADMTIGSAATTGAASSGSCSGSGAIAGISDFETSEENIAMSMSRSQLAAEDEDKFFENMNSSLTDCCFYDSSRPLSSANPASVAAHMLLYGSDATAAAGGNDPTAAAATHLADDAYDLKRYGVRRHHSAPQSDANWLQVGRRLSSFALLFFFFSRTLFHFQVPHGCSRHASDFVVVVVIICFLI